MRLAIAGKGGAGKSVVAGTLIRVLAQRGQRVLALDSDTLPGLTISLGAEAPDKPPLLDAAEKGENGRWRLRAGIGPVRAMQRYSTPAPDGVRLLQCGKHTIEGMAPVMGSVNAFYHVIHRFSRQERLGRALTFQDWTIVGDLPAGPRQMAYDWAPYADRYLLVVEPTWQSMLTARRIVRIASARERGSEFLVVANKAASPADGDRVADFLDLPLAGVVPFDEDVRASERLGVALIDHAPGSPAVAAIQAVVDRLERAI